MLAQKILEEDDKNNNDGFLSAIYGFLPSEAPLVNFHSSNKKRLKVLDNLVKKMGGDLTLTPGQFRRQVDKMECFPAVGIVSNDEILRTSVVIGNILQLFYYIIGPSTMKP